MSKMLSYGGINFEAHWGPDIHSSEFEKAFHDVYPKGEAAADHVARRAEVTPSTADILPSPLSFNLKKRYVYRSRYVLACLIGHTSM